MDKLINYTFTEQESTIIYHALRQLSTNDYRKELKREIKFMINSILYKLRENQNNNHNV